MALPSSLTANQPGTERKRTTGMRFLATHLIVVALLFSLYLAAAVLIDPRNDFGTGKFPVLIVDSRAQKMRLFTAFQARGPVDGLILGSSRSMKLRPAEFDRALHQRFFNFSVDNARAEDDLAIYRWVRRQGAHPKIIVVGLDLEALHNDNVVDHRLLKNDALMDALNRRRSSASILRRGETLKECFTISYAKNLAQSAVLAARHTRELPLMTFESDGYLRYARYEAQQRQGTFNLDQELTASIAEYQRRLKTMDHPSARRIQRLQTLVSEAHADGATVVIWITNLHPRVSRVLQAKTRYPQLLRETNAVLRHLDAQPGVTTFDFHDPAAYGGDTTDWYDGAHVGVTNARRIVARIVGGLR